MSQCEVLRPAGRCGDPVTGPIWVLRHLRGTKASAWMFLIEQAGDQTMRRSGALFSLQRAARVQQVRTEIGRLLRQHYAASSPPMSGRLAEVIKKLQTVHVPVRLGFGSR
jgi:hypothetical protein